MTTEEDIYRLLENGIEKTSQSEFARKHGFSKGFINDVLNRRRGVSDRLAEALGYVRKIVFVRKK